MAILQLPVTFAMCDAQLYNTVSFRCDKCLINGVIVHLSGNLTYQASAVGKLFAANGHSQHFQKISGSPEVADQNHITSYVASGHRELLAIRRPIEVEDPLRIEVRKLFRRSPRQFPLPDVPYSVCRLCIFDRLSRRCPSRIPRHRRLRIATVYVGVAG